MIKRLKLENIGPARTLEVEEFGARLNLVTGDNGLGKTFLLDACWHALTGSWPDGKQFYPLPEAPKNPAPAIHYDIIVKNDREVAGQKAYHYRNQSWSALGFAIPEMTGLVIYARIDGGFSVWDPTRSNRLHEPALDGVTQFAKDQVWDGLETGEGKQKRILCNGLLRDVEAWRVRGNGAFALLEGVLEGLSAGEPEVLKFGPSVRVRLDDAREIPTLQMPYGNVPVTLAAAGMRRVLALAYLMVWAWEEHVQAARLQRDAPTNRMVLLFDEIEAHLHPKWQRVFLPGLIKVVDGLLLKGQVEAISASSSMDLVKQADLSTKDIPRAVQIIATTHAPLIPASVETVWNKNSDRLFDFKLGANRQIHLEEVPFDKQGNVTHWLTSESFNFTPAYSVAAEQAMKCADDFMRLHPDPEKSPAKEKQAIHEALQAALGGDDEYWAYWLPYYKYAKASP